MGNGDDDDNDDGFVAQTDIRKNCNCNKSLKSYIGCKHFFVLLLLQDRNTGKNLQGKRKTISKKVQFILVINFLNPEKKPKN